MTWREGERGRDDERAAEAASTSEREGDKERGEEEVRRPAEAASTSEREGEERREDEDRGDDEAMRERAKSNSASTWGDADLRGLRGAERRERAEGEGMREEGEERRERAEGEGEERRERAERDAEAWGKTVSYSSEVTGAPST